MSGNAFLLTQQRLTDAHYLAIALREARDMQKPPITLNRFWKHPADYENSTEQLEEIKKWLDRVTEAGDVVVLEGDDHCVDVIKDYSKEKGLVTVAARWTPEPIIEDC